MNDIQVNEAEIVSQCPEDQSPIWLVNAWVKIYKSKLQREQHRQPKSGRQEIAVQRCSMIVGKGTLQEIQENPEFKKRCLGFLLRFDSGKKKKVFNFDTNRMEVKRISIIRSLGYGPKEW